MRQCADVLARLAHRVVACDRQPSTVVVNRFGDQQATPNGFVAYNTDRRIIVVAHCGTNFQSLESIANDGEAAPVPVDKSLRTSTTPQGALVHAGFQATWLRSRDDVLTGVRTALQVHPDYSVIAAGHSLGAAVSLLDGMYLRAQLPANVSMTVHPIEMPKTGNGAFADWVDATVRRCAVDLADSVAGRLAAPSDQQGRSRSTHPALSIRQSIRRDLDQQRERQLRVLSGRTSWAIHVR